MCEALNTLMRWGRISIGSSLGSHECVASAAVVIQFTGARPLKTRFEGVCTFCFFPSNEAQTNVGPIQFGFVVGISEWESGIEKPTLGGQARADLPTCFPTV